MRRTAATIGALAMVATIAAGCGSSDSKASSDTEPALTATTAAPATTTTEAAAGPTEAELTAMLLTADEMGTGWTSAPSSNDGNESQPSCLADLRTKGVIDDPRVDVQFAYDGGAAFAFEGLTWAGEDPDETFSTVTAALDGCTDLTVEVGGQQQPATLTDRALPTMGEQSRAWALSFTSDGQAVTVDLVVATQGDILIIAMDGLAQGTVTDEGTTQFVDGAATKVARALAAA